MKVNFNFQTRQGMVVAYAIARKISGEVCPELLSIQNLTFRFQGGLVVKPNLIELSQFLESWRTPKMEEWVVTHVEIRSYERSENGAPVSDEKKMEIWGVEKLSELKKAHWWHTPHVQDISTIKGRVCVFWDDASQDGYCETNPESNQDGYHKIIHDIEYARFVEGDLERAEKEAEECLASCYREVQK
jgi:hypothetical protein